MCDAMNFSPSFLQFSSVSQIACASSVSSSLNSHMHTLSQAPKSTQSNILFTLGSDFGSQLSKPSSDCPSFLTKLILFYSILLRNSFQPTPCTLFIPSMINVISTNGSRSLNSEIISFLVTTAFHISFTEFYT